VTENTSILDHATPRCMRTKQIDLGATLRQARKNAGLRQADTAVAIGVSRTTIVAIEQGERGVHADELRQLAALYHCAVDDFIGGSIQDARAERVVKRLLRAKQERIIERLLARSRQRQGGNLLVLIHALKQEEMEELAAVLLHRLIEIELSNEKEG